MTAEDKARELVDKFLCVEDGHDTDLFCDECGMNEKAAKLCALIAVDYIINSNPHSNPFNTDVFSTMLYWEEVKQELLKL